MDLVLALLSGFVVSWCALQRGILAWDAWHEAVRLEARDAWMRGLCRNETFFANMRVHSDVCEVVQRSASRTPFLHAVGAAMEAETAWLPAVALAAALALARFMWIVMCPVDYINRGLPR